MSASVASIGPAVHLSAIAAAAVGLAVALIARRTRPRAWSPGVAARDLALAVALAAAASVCIVAAGFVEVFGPARSRTGLVSALRNLDALLVVAFAVGLHLSLLKTRWLRARRPVGMALALDALLTLALSAGLAYPFWGERRMAGALFALLPLGSAYLWARGRRGAALGVAVAAFGWGWMFGLS